jgi:hypothetical protein
MLSGNQISKPNETAAKRLPETVEMKLITFSLAPFPLARHHQGP